MTERKLYQKKHGLPGISMYVGSDGLDGTKGKNIYFGYIADFFDSIEIEVDNIVRVAERTSVKREYYTGIFKKTGDETYIDQQDYVEVEKWHDENITIYDNDNKPVSTKEQAKKSLITWNNSDTPGDYNQYRKIYDDAEFYNNYSYDHETYQSKGYAKVDVSQKGIPQSWNNGGSSGWNAGSFNSQLSGRWNQNSNGSFNWPYSAYNPALFKSMEWLDIAPGRVVSAQLPSGENRQNATSTLFTIEINGHSYAFVTGVSDHLPKQNWTITDTGTSEDNPSIHDIIDQFEKRRNPAVDYLKSSIDLIETVEITDKLRPDIKAGDVLYFYTDKNYFNVYHMIEYMVVITPALENCTLEELIANASIVNPFNFRFLESVASSGSNFLVSQRKATAVHYPKSVSESGNNGHNFANLIANSGKSLLNLGLMQEDGTTGSVMKLADGVSSTANSLEVVSMSEDDMGFWNFKTNNVLKIKNLLIKNNNSGNLELEGTINPSDIIFQSDNRLYTLTEKDFDIRNRTFTLDATKYFSNVTLTKACLGSVIISYNKQNVLTTGTKFYGDSAYCRIRKYEYGVGESALVKLTEEYLTDTGHIIMVYAKMPNGMKYYSGHTIAVYNVAKKNYDITVYEELNQMSEVSKAVPANDERVIFISSGLSADQTSTPGSLDIYLPSSIGDNNARNARFYMNSKEFVNSLSSSWCTLYDKIGPVKEPEGSAYEGMYHYSFKINASSNIPTSTTVVAKSVKDYVSQPGSSSEVSGCEVFNAVMNKGSVNSLERSATIAVRFRDREYSNKELKSIYRLTQSGYVEKRKPPVINIDIKSDLPELESSNDIEKGVLSNQFQFFVDIDVQEFNADVWGSYVDEKDITLNFTVANATTDYEFVSEYGAQSTLSTYTLHSVIDKGQENMTNRFVRIKIDALEPENKSPMDMTQKEIESSIINSESDFYRKIRVRNKLSSSNPDDTEYTSYSNSIRISEDTFSEPMIRPSGINCESEIRFTGLTFTDCANGKFRFRVIVEMDNPLFSRLYFRYYVKNLYVSYQGNNFYYGTDNLAPERTIGRVTVYDYKYATKTLNAFICPISLTAVPPCLEENNFKRSDDNMQGSMEQNALQISPYIPLELENLYSPYLTDEQIIQNMINSQEVPWFEFALKTRYLQDNVMNMSVKPIHILDYEDKIAKDVPHLDELIEKFKTAFRTNKNYMCLTYNGNLFKQTMHDDRLWFKYNFYEYETQRYAQLKNNSPSFSEQSVTYQIRSAKLVNAMKHWNNVFRDNGLKGVLLTGGDNSTYGNGYQYLPDSYEDGSGPLSIKETRELNEEIFFSRGESARVEMNQPLSPGSYEPYPDQWYRSLLFKARWLYPYYYITEDHKEKIDGYDLTPISDFLASPKSHIPYNLAYTLFPRCAYDDEHDNVIVFMLRQPSIVRENQYMMAKSDDVYMLPSDNFQTISIKGFDVL